MLPNINRGFPRRPEIEKPTSDSAHQGVRRRGLAALGLLAAAGSVAAADLGGLRVLSASGEPLRAEIAVTALTPQEAGTLKVALASPEIYRQTQLQYRDGLDRLRFAIEDREQGRKVVVISSAVPVDADVLDLLVELTWNMGRFIRQYTFVLKAAPVAASAPVLELQSPASVTVAPGNTLWAIAQQARPEGASIYQTLAALLRANPSAFIDGNMNQLRAGALLALPSAEAAMATDEAQARALFSSQADAFGAYRQRIAQAAATAKEQGASAANAAAGSIQSTPSDQGQSSAHAEDALRLSSANPDVSSGDRAERAVKDRLEEERLATGRAVEEAESRMRALQGNIEAMKGLLQAQNETLAEMEQRAQERTELAQADSAQPAPVEPAAPHESTDDSKTTAAPVEPLSDAGSAAEGAAKDDLVPDAGATSPVGSTQENLLSRLRDNSITVLGAIFAVLLAILAALVLRRRADTQAKAGSGAFTDAEDEPHEQEGNGQPNALLERASGPAQAEVDKDAAARPNHLSDWDAIPPFPLGGFQPPPESDGDYPDDDEAPADAGTEAVEPIHFGFDLDLDKPSDPKAATVAAGLSLDTKLDPDLVQRLDAKLEAATAFMKMGDSGGARELLAEVLREGDPGQRARAQHMLANL